MSGLHCCTRAFSGCGKQGLLFVVVRGPLTVVASLAAEHRLPARRLQQSWPAGSRAQAQQLWRMGPAAPRHVGSSWTRARTRVLCTGRRIPNHSATREAPLVAYFIHNSFYLLILYPYIAPPPLPSPLW